MFNFSKKLFDSINNFNIRSDSLKRLSTNFISLFFLQATNFILPLLIVPYLLRVLGVEKFGLVSFAQALMTYFIVFTDYGFNLSATRAIAIHKKDLKKVINIFNTVIITKLLLCFVSFCFLLLLICLVPKFRDEWTVFALSFGIVIGYVLNPIWFFQGMEEMKYITYLNIIAKILFTVLTLLYITSPSDYILVNLFQGLGGIIASLLSLYIILKRFSLNLHVVSLQGIINELKEGWHIFVSNFSVNVYINSNIFILGLFTNETVVGYYSVAEKVIFAIRQILNVFSQVVYPYICNLTLTSHIKIQQFFKKIYVPFGTAILGICSMVFLFADQVVLFLSGKYISDVTYLIKLMSFVPFIVLLNIPAYQTLLAYNIKKSYSIILMIGSVVNICLNVLLSYNFAAIGTAITVNITEILITAGLYTILELKHSQYSLFINSSNTL